MFTEEELILIKNDAEGALESCVYGEGLSMPDLLEIPEKHFDMDGEEVINRKNIIRKISELELE